MTFDTPSKVLSTITAGDDAAWIQSENRRRINEAANGNPPLTDTEAKQLNVRINVNWGELPIAFAHARRQYDSAILGPMHFFRVSVRKAPIEKQTDWSVFITNEINTVMKESEAYACLKESQTAALVAHGIGPQLWYDQDSWLPDFIDIADLRIPTDTQISFKNLEWFAVRHRYTPGELVRKVWTENALPGWDKKAISQILNTYKNISYGEVTYDWETNPEQMAELVKQNFGFYSSDAMPTISLWHFYYMEDDEWYMCVVPDTAAVQSLPLETFLYKSPDAVAEKLCYLLHVQFGDLNNKAPFLYHSVRSLGFLLMEPCFWTNLTRCRLLQHTHETMNTWYRVQDPSGKARAQKIELFDRCVIPEGVSVVPQSDRHQIDANLVHSVMADLRQLQSEASVTYTQQLDTGTQKEQTATETMANVQRVNAMMSGLLGRWFRREIHAYREICRRFCRENTSDKDAKKFQDRCQQYGIPRQFINEKQWDIEPEMTMGSGNPTMAMAEAQQLLQMRPLYDPTAQQEILHDVTAVFTGNVRKAARWVPLDKRQGMTDAQAYAANLFGSLMQGVPIPVKEGIPAIEQVEVLLGMMAGKITNILNMGGMTTQETIMGLANTGSHVGQLIGMIGSNPQEKERANNYGKALGKLMNDVKAFQQRLAQQQKAQGEQGSNGTDGMETIAELQKQLILAQAKAKTTELNAEQKRRHNEMKFQGQEKRKDVSTLAEVRRQAAKTAAEIANQNAKAQAEVAMAPVQETVSE